MVKCRQGVPLESILSPLYFVLFINKLKTPSILYIDDTSIMYSEKATSDIHVRTMSLVEKVENCFGDNSTANSLPQIFLNISFVKIDSILNNFSENTRHCKSEVVVANQSLLDELFVLKEM